MSAVLPQARPVLPSGDRWEAELGSIRLRYGAGRLAELGAIARKLGGSRVLLVSDAGLRAAGHVARAEASLAGAGLEHVLFSEAVANPTSSLVERGARLGAKHGVDLIVALGGGSSLDTAKGMNFLLTSGGRIEDYWGYGKARSPMLPSIGIPTTGGTGSEAQSYTLISQDETGRKMACGDPGALFREVLLDPELALTIPAGTVAAAGVDALSHALESHVTRKRSLASGELSHASWGLLASSFGRCFDAGDDQLECRSRMLIGAHLAGAAIETSMLGATHACANPLTARFDIPHGEAIGLMLPHVIRFNAETAEELYRQLDPEGPEAIAGWIESLRGEVGLPESLEACGVPRQALHELAILATQEWTGEFNPRAVSEADYLELYEAAF